MKKSKNCEICNEKIELTFLNKKKGTVIKDTKGMFHYICSNCQKKLNNDKEKILQAINSN